MRVSSIEKQLGIETFVSATRGVGGVIRETPEDFVVEEILVDGSKAELAPKRLTELSGQGRYLICLIVKRNRDTLLTARRIAKQLGISERRVQIAGIKDKNALTTQHVSLENIRLKQLKRIRINGVQVYPLAYSANMVFPHMLFGNKFSLVIRGIGHATSTIQERTSGVAEELRVLGGVPNFFGHQRFGTIRPITHLVGKALAQNNLEKAALLFLSEPGPSEHPQSREMRRTLLETGDFEGALSHFPRVLLYERLMLAHLVKHPGDYAGAFRRLPKRLSRLFLQAYQSYLFNRFLSQRLVYARKNRMSIGEPQIGDYVIHVDTRGLPNRRHFVSITHAGILKDLRKAVKKREMCLAMPLIGYKQATSGGWQGKMEKSILDAEKITQHDFTVPSLREVSAAGELRPVLTPIINLQVCKPTPDELKPRMKKVRMQFTLHRGCYATVVLREFMKSRHLIKAGF